MPLTVNMRGDVLGAARETLARWLLGGKGGADRWLVNLRWVAVAGMLLTSVVGNWLVPALQLRPLVGLLSAIALVNVGWTWLLRRRPQLAGRTVAGQILVDLGLLGAMLWFSGGVTNPFACFLGFHTVLAGLLGSRRTIVWATVATVVVAVALLAAAPLPPSSASLDVLANAISIVALAGITGFMVTLFARQLDELREQSARSEKLAGLGRTVAAICHELNTPLGTIVIAGKDLALIGRESGSSEVQELSSTIVNEAQRASSTIGLMRGYVGLSEKRAWIDLADFVPSYADRRLDQIGYLGKRSFAISRPGAAQAEARPVNVLVLEAALCHVLSNVLSNAVEALQDTSVPSIEVRVADEGGSATVTIRDNGKGVSAELAPRLGEPFQTTKTAQGGRGLGLYICSLLVDEMSGRLRLDSTPGEGTEVTLALPRTEGADVR